MENKVGILPTCWGPALWFSIHSIAYAYNPQIDKENYFDFFSNLGNILPCEECRIHYKQNLNRQELVIALESQENLFRWAYDLHNKVNRQTGVPESKWPSYDSIKEKYSSFRASCDQLPGVCGTGPGIVPKKKMKMVEQFGDINEDQLPFLIALVIMALIICGMFIYICLK
jgi:hypothetical protein